LAEGRVESLGQIRRLEIADGRAYVYLTRGINGELSKKPRLILTACGNGTLNISPVSG